MHYSRVDNKVKTELSLLYKTRERYRLPRNLAKCTGALILTSVPEIKKRQLSAIEKPFDLDEFVVTVRQMLGDPEA